MRDRLFALKALLVILTAGPVTALTQTGEVRVQNCNYTVIDTRMWLPNPAVFGQLTPEENPPCGVQMCVFRADDADTRSWTSNKLECPPDFKILKVHETRILDSKQMCFSYAPPQVSCPPSEFKPYLLTPFSDIEVKSGHKFGTYPVPNAWIRPSEHFMPGGQVTLTGSVTSFLEYQLGQVEALWGTAPKVNEPTAYEAIINIRNSHGDATVSFKITVTP